MPIPDLGVDDRLDDVHRNTIQVFVRICRHAGSVIEKLHNAGSWNLFAIGQVVRYGEVIPIVCDRDRVRSHDVDRSRSGKRVPDLEMRRSPDGVLAGHDRRICLVVESVQEHGRVQEDVSRDVVTDGRRGPVELPDQPRPWDGYGIDAVSTVRHGGVVPERVKDLRIVLDVCRKIDGHRVTGNELCRDGGIRILFI